MWRCLQLGIIIQPVGARATGLGCWVGHAPRGGMSSGSAGAYPTMKVTPKCGPFCKTVVLSSPSHSSYLIARATPCAPFLSLVLARTPLHMITYSPCTICTPVSLVPGLLEPSLTTRHSRSRNKICMSHMCAQRIACPCRRHPHVEHPNDSSPLRGFVFTTVFATAMAAYPPISVAPPWRKGWFFSFGSSERSLSKSSPPVHL